MSYDYATENRAIEYAASKIMHATDWQEVQAALFDHPVFGPWLRECDADGLLVIRAAEKRLGSRLPPTYAD